MSRRGVSSVSASNESSRIFGKTADLDNEWRGL
jgi:hypothetical protein